MCCETSVEVLRALMQRMQLLRLGLRLVRTSDSSRRDLSSVTTLTSLARRASASLARIAQRIAEGAGLAGSGALDMEALGEWKRNGLSRPGDSGEPGRQNGSSW